jgi:hypothetical protein
MKTKYLLAGALLILLALGLTACAQATTAPVPTVKPCPTAAPCPSCPTCPEPPKPVVEVVPNQDTWANSPHNTTDAAAFTHWDEADPKEVPVTCAKCHTTAGFQDYLGADGSAVNVVDKAVPAPAGTLQCVACHNTGTATLTTVKFPYTSPDKDGNPVQVEITGLGSEAVCMTCHQGTASMASVDKAIADNGLTEDLDKVSVPAGTPPKALGFVNVHYRAAAATLYGTFVKGGYQYEGKTYDGKFSHTEGLDTCVGCHDQHSLELKLEKCGTCHDGVKTADDTKNIREPSSSADYDGDGDTTEGIAGEIEGLQGMLMQAMQAYSKEVAGSPIVYSPDAYPYFFIDTNGDGQLAEDEAQSANKYASWTGRLLKAAYNYQFSVKDPGAFAHNGKYVIELLYDSIEDLNTKLATPVDLSKAHRIDSGHFAGSEEAFRHWDDGGVVEADCAKCHSATGLPFFIKEGVSIEQPLSNGFMCSTCHDEANWPARYAVNDVTFPSGKVVTFGEANDANLCIECHQGRQSKSTVDAAIAVVAPENADTVMPKFRFTNPHYFAAGANLFGSEASGGYEYDGQTYVGKNAHVQGFDTCIACHDTHASNVKMDACKTCHSGVEDSEKIRMSTVDYDGDGDATEGMAAEVQHVAEKLLAAIQTYALDKAGLAITYTDSNPYWLGDADGNGTVDPGERYPNFTPRLLRAAYNYQWVMKDPGAFAHNAKYVIQLMYDSIKDLGGDVTGLTRP